MTTRICQYRNTIWFILTLSTVHMSYAMDVKVSWEANKETDLAGYSIYIGKSSRNYNQHVKFGNVTQYIVRDLPVNQELFMAMTAHDKSGNESKYSKELNFKLGDNQAPFITQVTPLGLTELRVLFNEKVDSLSAQKTGNYSVNGIEIYKAIVENNKKSVRLITTEHTAGVIYDLSAAGIKDIAVPANTMTNAGSYSYRYEGQEHDVIAPSVSFVGLANQEALDVYFSEPMLQSSVENLSNYQITPAVQILSVKTVSRHHIRLQTNAHKSGQVYKISVKNVKDISSEHNQIQSNTEYSYSYMPGDNVEPVIIMVQAVHDNNIDVLFNETVAKQSAENINNYGINGGIRVQHASLDSSNQIVHLQTTGHQAEQAYQLTVNNIKDNSVNQNIIQQPQHSNYVLKSVDQNGPVIRRVIMLDNQHLRVFFNEKVDKKSAENFQNYQLDDEIKIIAIQYDVGGYSVLLETTPHESGIRYRLDVNGIKDVSESGNVSPALCGCDYVLPDKNSSVLLVSDVSISKESELFIEMNRAVTTASARNVNNYVIDGNVSVMSVELDDEQKRIKLKTSAHEIDHLYSVSIQNLVDKETDQTLTATVFPYYFTGMDQVAPFIQTVQVNEPEYLKVMFSEPVSKETAENIENYQIEPFLQILSAELDGTQRVVSLTTEKHSSGVFYSLSCSRVQDVSANSNTIATASKIFYSHNIIENIPPFLSNIDVIDSEHIRVVFSEPVEFDKSLLQEIFTFNKEIIVQDVQCGFQSRVCLLTVSLLEPLQSYQLSVSGIYDNAGTMIDPENQFEFTYNLKNTSRPLVTDVETEGTNKIHLYFNEPVLQNEATNVTNFSSLEDINIFKAEYDQADKKVTLTTSLHEPDRSYTLLLNNVKAADNPEVTIDPDYPVFYHTPQEEKDSPFVKKLDIFGENALKITFSEPVDKMSAENIKNYSISPAIYIQKAELDETSNCIALTIDPLFPGIIYSMKISGVLTKGIKYNVIPDTVLAYRYFPVMNYQVSGSGATRRSSLEVDVECYLDRSYTIKEFPSSLKKLTMIITANNDRFSQSAKYLQLYLNQPTIVWIAYDSRAVAVPYWLNAKFVKTNQVIKVAENATEMDLWQGYFPAGTLDLGGNFGYGAKEVRSMYFILLQEPPLNISETKGMLEGIWTNWKRLPEKVELWQNYPNPFNPTTTIRVGLPGERWLKLTVYNILGQLVKTLYNAPGSTGLQEMVWDGTDHTGDPVAAGVYFYRLEVWEQGVQNGQEFRQNFETSVKKMILLK